MELEIIVGTVNHVTFYNDENGYSVLKIIPDDDWNIKNPDGTFTVVGNLPPINVGQSAEFEGYWIENPRYGEQLKCMGMKVLERRMGNQPQTQDTLFDVSDDQAATLRGTIERITYYNPENGWSVVKVDPYREDDYPEEAMAYDGTIAVVGTMPELVEGEDAEFNGKWVTNPQYGKQFKASQVIPIAPSNKEGIIRYIADTVFGIGQVTAKRIYNHFGDETMEILDNDPERVREVVGLKPRLADNLIQTWSENRGLRQIMIHLQSYGITSRMAKKIFDEYGMETLQVIQQNPYQLAADIHGVGFRKADDMARGMGIPADSPYRIRAGLVYALQKSSQNGHTYLPRKDLLQEAQELLGVNDLELVEQQLNEQILAKKVRQDKLTLDDGEVVEAVYLPMYYNCEVGVESLLRLSLDAPSKVQFRMKNTNWDEYLNELAEDNNVELTPTQQGAVRDALTNKLSVLTGGPGTGKTTTLRMVINAIIQENLKFKLASPTGRAAKRLAEATEEEATTIHRLLGWNGQEGRFDHDEDNPLDVDMVVIDEASMIDLLLFYNLLKALPVGCHLMLVGDVDQLPSVGAGNVLNDIIDSGVARVTRLTQIFRQAEASHIVQNAHRINQGIQPMTDNESDDFFFFNMGDPEEAGDMIVDLVTKRLERKIGEYDPMHDVQVIAPMYRGAIGVNYLNQALQESLNPPSPSLMEVRFGGKVFRRGDKVMQTKNNYDKDVFNGDIGFVYGMDKDQETIQVTIDGVNVSYRYDEADEQLIHAYCISTHRSQGSEYPIVVMPVMTQHYIMLQRNLLYTAITRAKKMVVLVGTRKAVAIAVNNDDVSKRYSGLLPRLKNMPPSDKQLRLV